MRNGSAKNNRQDKIRNSPAENVRGRNVFVPCTDPKENDVDDRP